MTSLFPVGRNPLAALHEFVTQGFTFSEVLDFARYTIRMDPEAQQGYFKSELKVGTFAGKIRLVPGRFTECIVETDAPEFPPQVRLALERTGLVIRDVVCGASWA